MQGNKMAMNTAVFILLTGIYETFLLTLFVTWG